MVDAGGRVSRQVYGEAIDGRMLVAALRESSADPGAVPAGIDLLDRLRILCTVYDPRSGRYRLDYALFIEIAAGLSILGATAWYLWSEWRRQRLA